MFCSLSLLFTDKNIKKVKFFENTSHFGVSFLIYITMEYEKNKCLYRDDGSFWFDDFYFYRPVFFNGNLNPYYQFGKVEKVVKNNTEFLENLHSRVYRKSQKQIMRIACVERGVKNKKLHTHMVIETPEHLSTDTFLMASLTPPKASAIK